MFLFHTYLGLLGVFGLVSILALNVFNEKKNGPSVRSGEVSYASATRMAVNSFNNAEVIDAMGSRRSQQSAWKDKLEVALALQVTAGEGASKLAAFSKAFRLTLQSLAIGLAAWLVIRQEISPGMMIAGSILLGKALAPADQLIGGWTAVTNAKEQFKRLVNLFESMPALGEKTSLPPPTGRLQIEKAVIAAPGSQDPIVKGISFALQPGSHLGIVGPSGAGKSTLARALLGLWPCLRGSVRLDGADIFQWDRENLGPHIGYLPQNTELLEGTISDNIARMGEWKSEDVVEAAKLVGVHDIILRLPRGYDTVIGSRTGALSGGQLQRIGLARAFYGHPKYVVLDEPNTNLDQAGELALVAAIKRLKAMGTTLIVISHNVKLLAHLDTIMVLRNGQISDFGRAGKILAAYEKTPNEEATAELTEVKKPVEELSLKLDDTSTETAATENTEGKSDDS